MDFDEINRIIDKFNNSTLRDLEIREGDFHLHLSKNQVTTTAVKTATTSASVSRSSSSSDKNEEVKHSSCEIKAPVVGTVYLQPAPGKEAYVREGQMVHRGDVVCIIEAMKMMTEVKSKIDGIITKIEVQNEDLVEFDQPLFKIKKI